MADDHFMTEDLQVLHDDSIQSDTTEGGACLTGHDKADFKNFRYKITCNFRYQAYQQAKAEKKIRKRLHSYMRKRPQVLRNDNQLRLFLTTSVYPRIAGGLWPGCLSATLPLPQEGDWHVGGPTRPIQRGRIDTVTDTIKVGHNFTNARWPYWNNAHHLISKGTFVSRIASEDAQVSELIKQSLLKAKYNINHKINMLLLPQDREVAAVLGFVRHLQQKEDDAPLGQEVRDHPCWSRLLNEMEGGLNNIIVDYAEICRTAIDEGHENPEPELDKRRLEKLSKKLLKMILDWGAGGPQQDWDGKSLDALANKLGF